MDRQFVGGVLFLEEYMNELKQRKGLQSRSYKIDPNLDFVEVQFNSTRDKLKYRIKLTDIGNEIQYEADNVIAGKVFFIITSLITLFCLGYYFFGNHTEPGGILVNVVIWGVISIIGLFVPNKDDIVIVNGHKEIRLFRTKPSEEKVLEFANHLINIANDKKKEMFINFDLSEEHFLDNVQYLFAIDLINRKELEELKSEYKLKQLL